MTSLEVLAAEIEHLNERIQELEDDLAQERTARITAEEALLGVLVKHVGSIKDSPA